MIPDRLRGAVWGQLVGDAACLGSHWIYDTAEIARRWPELRGFEEPHPRHYHAGKTPGEPTHYGHAALIQLAQIASSGSFDEVAFGSAFVETFGSPEYRGYTDKAMRGTLANHAAFRAAHPGESFDFQQGADDFEPATVSRLAPVVAAHRGDPDLLRVVERATRVVQNNDRAVAHAQCHALILRALLRGAGLRGALDEAVQLLPSDGEAYAAVRVGISRATDCVAQDARSATAALGQHCRLDQSFPSAVQCALRNEHDYSAAILDTARAGGDSAGRAAMIGAWLGATLGVDAIPRSWRERLRARDEIARHVERLVARA
ncbi:MAG: ADP-ribosylglycohydrolase family protein [Chloroflexi bacterium]|nr:ADP-ribosylglycohydrolase family protein [Chloroflexota bacterium]